MSRSCTCNFWGLHSEYCRRGLFYNLTSKMLGIILHIMLSNLSQEDYVSTNSCPYRLPRPQQILAMDCGEIFWSILNVSLLTCRCKITLSGRSIATASVNRIVISNHMVFSNLRRYRHISFWKFFYINYILFYIEFVPDSIMFSWSLRSFW